MSLLINFLAHAMDLMPGSKNPSKKYIEARKTDHLTNNNRQFKNTSNPQRASKNKCLRHKANFDYKMIQYEFYYQSRKTGRKILSKNNNKPLLFKKCEIELYLRNTFEMTNNHIRESYDTLKDIEFTTQPLLEITPELLMNSMKKIVVDTSPCPNKVILKVIKHPVTAKILAKIMNRMIRTAFVSDAFNPLT